MIVNNSESEVITVGDIKNNTVGIDSANIGFITHILSTNLYSKPIESFLRETVSNAWDSHVEAGVTEPVLLELATDSEGKDFCRIQDFGVGLSPERFSTIYRNIGSSTKRGDNTQIGGFGIGRFSALAYTDTVYITSNYEGTKYLYLMYKDGGNINIDELHTSSTEDRNGLEILVYIKDKADLRKFIYAINSQLTFFENLYISIDNLVDHIYKESIRDFNNLKIKHYDTFTVNTIKPDGPITICLGKVSYPIDWTIEAFKKYNIVNYPICLTFNIGELSVTPNRESLLYNNHTIEAIISRLDKVKEELDEIINSQNTVDYNDLQDFVKNFYSTIDIILIEGVYIRVPKVNLFQGKINKELIQTYSAITDVSVVASKVVTSSTDYLETHYSGQDKPRGIRFSKVLKPMYPIFITAPTYSKNLRKYLKGLDRYILIKPLSYRALYTFCREYKINFTGKAGGYTRENLRIVLAYIYNKWNSYTKCTDAIIPKEILEHYKQEALAQKAYRESNKEKINIGRIRSCDKYISTKEFQTVADYSYKELGNLIKETNKKIVIYGIKADRRLHGLHELLCNIKLGRRYIIIETVLSNLKLFNNIPNFINIDTIMRAQYPVIRKIVTAAYIRKHYAPLVIINTDSLKQISIPLAKIAMELRTYMTENATTIKNNILDELVDMCNKHSYYDSYMMGVIKEHEKLLNNAMFLTKFVTNNTIKQEAISLLVDYILARKLFIPNYITVNKLRNKI